MPKKIKLKLSDLSVTSFTTTESSSSKGGAPQSEGTGCWQWCDNSFVVDRCFKTFNDKCPPIETIDHNNPKCKIVVNPVTDAAQCSAYIGCTSFCY